jgi:hypothetical protein
VVALEDAQGVVPLRGERRLNRGELRLRRGELSLRRGELRLKRVNSGSGG